MLGNKNTDRLDTIFGEKCPSPKYEAPKNPIKENFKINYELKDLIKNEEKKLIQCEVNSDEYRYRWYLLHRLYEVTTLRENNTDLIKFLKDKGLIEEYLNSID